MNTVWVGCEQEQPGSIMGVKLAIGCGPESKTESNSKVFHYQEKKTKKNNLAG